MTTYRFDEVSQPAIRTGECPVCHRKGRRSTTIINTISPFNKNPDGTVRTYAEVARHVGELAAEWSAIPYVHVWCEQR